MAYPTLNQVKAYIPIAGDTENVKLTQMLDGAITAVEQDTGRLWVATTATRNFRAEHPFVTQHRTMLSFFEDLATITSITNGDGTVLAAADYDAISTPGTTTPFYQIHIRNTSNVRWQNGADGTRIAIAGKWGYSEACPDDIFLAILELVHLSQAAQADGSGLTITPRSGIIDKGQWPPRVLRTLDNRRR